jgi:hypothetical protein
MVCPGVFEEVGSIGTEDLAVHDAVPTGYGLAVVPEFVPDDRLESFRMCALAGDGPKRDQLRVGEGSPDLSYGSGDSC